MPHTKGQWTVKGVTVGPSRHFRAYSIEPNICEMNSSLAPETVTANAHLIAAAPELLEALKRACNHLIMDIDRNGKGVQCKDAPDALVDFRILINKAEGKLTV